MFGDSSGRSSGGGRPPRLFLDQNEARRTEKSFCEAGPGGGGGTWVFFWWVCAARDSKLAPRSKKKFPLNLIPRSRNGPIFYTPF